MVRWQKILYAAGWGAGMWPQRFGGAGWSVVQQHIFEEECAAAGAPAQMPFSLRMVAPVLMTFGNARAAGVLPAAHPLGRGLVVSGLLRARLRLGPRLAAHQRGARRRPLPSSTARRPGIRSASTPTGSSAWCAPAHEARQQDGISFLLIDMKSPGSACGRSSCSTASTRSTTSSSRTSGCRSRTSWARRTRAGPTPSSCWATSAPTTPASATASARSTI